jgi:hypothetical protein
LPEPVRAAVLARLLLLLAGGSCLALLLAGGSCLALQLREAWPELLLASDFVLDLDPLPELLLASDFVLDLDPLPAEEELGLSSSSRDLVVVEGLLGLALSSRHLLSLPPCCCPPPMGWFWNNIGRKKNACAGRGLAAVTANVTAANTTAVLPVGRKRMRPSIVSVTLLIAHGTARSM